MPSPSVMVSSVQRPLFNPLALPGLLWLVHADDSTLTGGNVSAIDDRVASYAFAQGTAANRPIGNTSELTGHTVWEFANTGRRYLSRTGAPLAGALDGAPACTMGVYAKVVDAGIDNDFCGHTSNITTYAESVRHRADAVSSWLWREASGAGSTNYTDASTFPSGWNLLTGVSDGAGGLEFFANGTSQGTSSGTHRSPASLSIVVLGEALNNTDANKSLFIGGFFCCTGQLSSTQLANLATWFAASFA